MGNGADDTAPPDDTLAAAGRLLPGARIGLAETIRISKWSRVIRVRVGGADWTGPRTLIVKRFPGAGDGWVRESSALAVVPPGAPAPRLVASAADPALVVMTDAGAGPSVADALLSGTATEAGAALEGFADALAAFHLSTLGVRESFEAGLAARSGGDAAASAIPGLARRAADDLGTWCERLGVSVPGGALSALAAIPGQLAASGPASLTSGDVCPDNNVRTTGRYVLIDFEEAEWRPVAWDAAFLTVPWPGCWCSFPLPGAVAGRVLGRYRAAIAKRLPYAATPEFTADLTAATTAWALMSTSWYLGSALGDDPPQHGEAGKAPTRRARILHYLARARDGGPVPVLAELAGRLRAELVRRWGEVALEYAPAFRGG